MNMSKRFQIRLIVIVPLIFFGITILAANITYHLTLYYAGHSIPINHRILLDPVYLFRLKSWVLLLALFSLLCGFLLIYAIIHPMQKILNKAKDIEYYQNASPLNDGSEIDSFCSSFDDVLSLLKSHLKEQEMRVAAPLLSRVKRADQLAALGFLSSRIAHEFRNPLGSIQGFVQLLKKDMKEGDTKKIYLDTILQSIENMNLMVEDLIEFSRPCTDISEVRDINRILGETLKEAQRDNSQKDIKIQEGFQEDIPFVKVNPEKIHKAFLNILRIIFQFANPAEEIMVTTSDTLPGFISVCFCTKRSFIPPEDIAQIFVPFSVIQKKRIGLGLPIAQHIISAHDGDIWIQSDQDSGTSFMVELPVAENASSAIQKREMALQREDH